MRNPPLQARLEGDTVDYAYGYPPYELFRPTTLQRMMLVSIDGY